MAKATYKCTRCAGLVEIIGQNRRLADERAEYLGANGGLCNTCWQADRDAARAAETAAAADKAVAIGLPALTGSDKQVAWATTLRGKMVEKLDELVAYATKFAAEHAAESSVQQQFDQIKVGSDLIRAKVVASWWIDNRLTDSRGLITALLPEITAILAARVTAAATPEEAAQEQAAQEEALLKPAVTLASKHVAEITHKDNAISVTFPLFNDALRDAMHALGYKWVSPHWSKALSYRTGDPTDRMAEAASTLLAAGFMVRLHDVQARDKTVSGQYQTEQRRWVGKGVAGQYIGWYAIQWPKSDDLYAPAKRLLGARYKDGTIYVPPGSADEVLDFAQQYGFLLSPGATELAEANRAALARGVVVTAVKKPKQASVKVADQAKPDPIESTEQNGVDPSLQDD